MKAVRIFVSVTALVLAVGCGTKATTIQNVPIYGSHFAQDSWMPAVGISERGAIKRTRGHSTRAQTVFDQPYDYSGYNNGAVCAIIVDNGTATVGQTVPLKLYFHTTDTYLSQFASTNNSFQLTSVTGANGTYVLSGYFNTQGTVIVTVAAANAPYTSQTTCSATVQVSGGWNNNNGDFWSWWYAPPYHWYWPNQPPHWHPGSDGGSSSATTTTTTTSSTSTTTTTGATPTPVPAPPPPVGPTPVHLYRSHVTMSLGHGAYYEDFLYSQNPAEGVGVYSLEGAAFDVMPTPYGTFNVALMRCLVNGQSLPYHFLSVEPNCEGQRVEGAVGWVSGGQAAGTTPLTRIYAPATGAHLTTKSQAEIAAALGIGYYVEGPQGFAY